jgi:hypothetical protein
LLAGLWSPHSRVRWFQPASLGALIEAGAVDCAVVVNPNNPTADTIGIATLDRWRQRLLQSDGLLIVDEAFADCAESNSSLQLDDHKGLIILRSLGKFFSLAGLRVDFALGDSERLQQLKSFRGLWSVSGATASARNRALHGSRATRYSGAFLCPQRFATGTATVWFARRRQCRATPVICCSVECVSRTHEPYLAPLVPSIALNLAI